MLMGLTTPIQQYLFHKANLTTVLDQGSRDGYGKLQKSESSVEIYCFYSNPNNKKRSEISKETVEHDGVVFTEKNVIVKIGDKVGPITSKLGSTIDSRVHVVVKIKPIAGDEGVHHLELLVQSNG